jgi:hypothetical protein
MTTTIRRARADECRVTVEGDHQQIDLVPKNGKWYRLIPGGMFARGSYRVRLNHEALTCRIIEDAGPEVTALGAIHPADEA